MSASTSKNWSQKKVFVADQPGMIVLIAGLLVAVFFGLFLKAQLTDSKIKPHIQMAIAKDSAGLEVSFDSASISLARGSLPELAVVIRKIQIESKEKCWLMPLLEINELRLPLSLSALFKGKFDVRDVFADEAHLSLRSDPAACSSAQVRAAREAPAQVTGVAQEAVSAVSSTDGERKIFPQETSLRSLSIQTLRVHYLPIAFTSFAIEDLQILRRQSPQEKLEVRGQLHIGGETLSGDYSSKAQIQMFYEESENPLWNLFIKGNWREGHYDLISKYSAKNDFLEMDLKLKHLPVSQLLPILKKYRWINQDFGYRPLWISGSASAQGNPEQLNQFPLIFQSLKLEGDVGEIEFPRIEVTSLQPLQAKAFSADVRSLKVSELLSLAGRPHPGAAFGQLGVFQGQLKYDGVNSVVLQGEHSGLEFIFANQGSRQIQTLSLISGLLKYQTGGWDILIEKVKPAEGLFIGDIKVSADENWKKVEVKAKVEDLALAPSVQKLMTQGGSFGSISGDVGVSMSSGKLSDLRGNVSSQEVVMEGFRFRRPRLNFRSQQGEIQIDMRSSELEVQISSVANRAVKLLLDRLEWKQDVIDLGNFSSRFKTQSLNTFSWAQLQGKGPQFTLNSNGSWDEKGQLAGDLDLVIRGKKKNFRIDGHRDEPRFVEKP